MAKIAFLCSFAMLIIFCLDIANGECTSDLLRDYAVDACNHINKRSVLHDIYRVEDFPAKHHVTLHFNKLTRKDFPNGGYLRIRKHHMKKLRPKKFQNYVTENTSDENEILTRDIYQGRIIHKNNFAYEDSYERNDVFSTETDRRQFNHKSNDITYRIRRDVNKEIPIDYCCSQATRDICNRYSCH